MRRCPASSWRLWGSSGRAATRGARGAQGIGHPDTICDSLVEAIAVSLNRMYVGHLGVVVHYNIDKALLIAGQCHKAFGQSEVTRPVEFIVGDRATFEVGGRTLPVGERSSFSRTTRREPAGTLR